MKDKGVVTLAAFSTAGEAAIYRSLLESAGIEVMTTGEFVNEIYPMGESWAGIELRVAPEDEREARKILAAHFDEAEFERESSGRK
jgi:hypothetical protein